MPPDADGLAGLVGRLGDVPVVAVIESMNGARFVHDQLELAGWDVRIADAVKAKGLAPLACKTDKIDAWVLAELARRDLVPEIWLPDPAVRAERERARFRLHLWQSTTAAAIALIDVLDEQIDACERELRDLGADHRYVPLLMTVPGVGWVLAYTIASEIGDIGRFPSPAKLVGYSGLTPSVEQSGERDRRGPLRKNGPDHLRWALVEAAHTASRHPLYAPIVERHRARHGRKKGTKTAALTISRKLSHAIWHMLTTNQPFAPAGAARPLAAQTAL